MKKNEDYDIGRCLGVVKRMFFCILLFSFPISQGLGQGKEVRVTLKVKETPLQQVLKKITKQTGYQFVYSSSRMIGEEKITVEVTNESLDRTLELCLKGTNLGFKIEEKHVIISPKLRKAESEQNMKVYEGTVLDNNGEVLPGVTIVLKGTKQGVSTDTNGNFEIPVPDSPGNVLVFSFIGMKTTEVQLKDQRSLRVAMEEEISEVDEVVVNGLFTQNKNSYTGAVSTVKGEDLLRVSQTNIFQALATLTPGLRIVEDNAQGSNPNHIPEIIIRGTTSLASQGELGLNRPLIMLDGVEITYVRQWTSRVTPFSTVKEVYADVIYDLKEAERFLVQGMENVDGGNEFTNTPQIHFNLHAAQATLARVYWMKGDLDSAGIYARKVIDYKELQLAEPVEIKDMMAQIVAKKEAVWGLFNNQLTETYKNSFYGMVGSTVDPNLYPNDYWDYEELYPTGNGSNEMRLGWIRNKANDPIRKKYFMKLLREENMTTSQPSYGSQKEHNIAGINLIRLPEMYLIMAESLLEKEPDVALEYFDTFIASRGLMRFKDRGQKLTSEDIDKERKKEFFGEGQEFYNMKREMRTVYLTASTWATLKGNDEMYTLLIPDSEFEFRYDGNGEDNVE